MPQDPPAGQFVTHEQLVAMQKDITAYMMTQYQALHDLIGRLATRIHPLQPRGPGGNPMGQPSLGNGVVTNRETSIPPTPNLTIRVMKEATQTPLSKTTSEITIENPIELEKTMT